MLGVGFLRLGLIQLHHHLQVFELALRVEQWIQSLAERGRFIHHFARGLVVVPEIVGGSEGVEFAETFIQAGDVKETSADG